MANVLSDAGYATAFIGKWHMGGETDEPRPGFDHWVKRGLRIPQYQRYQDDMTLFADDRRQLEEARAAIGAWLYEHRRLAPLLHSVLVSGQSVEEKTALGMTTSERSRVRMVVERRPISSTVPVTLPNRRTTSSTRSCAKLG